MSNVDNTSRQSKQTATPQHNPELTLGDFANLRRWVAWREEWRQNKKGEWYLTKIPYDPNRNQQARIPTDPSTWGTREEAERAWRERYDDGQSRGGVGIVLGELDDGSLLMGSDLDHCFEDNGDFKPWAVDVLTRINSYAEVSPSGSGTKQFFLAAAKDAEAVKALFGRTPDGRLKTRRVFAAAAKHHELAIDRARFYTVTGAQVENLPPTLRTVSIDDIRWFLEKAGPAFLAQHGGKKGDGKQRGRDESGSGYGFRFMTERKRGGASYEQAKRAIEADQGKAGEWARGVDERQLERAWENAPNAAASATLDIVRMSTVRLAPVRWIWRNRLARGKVTIISGWPFIGKSHISIDMAARITRGDAWPDNEPEGESYAPLGNVLMLSAEDAVNDTIGPRLQAANADLDRVDVVKMVTEADGSRRLFKLQTDLQLLTEKITTLRAAGRDVVLVSVDPISAYMGEKEGNSITTFRPVLSQLADFAETNDVAVLAIHHPPKSAENAMHAFSGSLAFIAAPRIGFIVTKEEGSERRLMLAVGSNIGAQAEGLGFYIKEHTLNLTITHPPTARYPNGVCRLSARMDTTRLEWDRASVTVSANEAVRAADGKAERASKRQEAEEFLQALLSVGPVEQQAVKVAAARHGITERTLKRAKDKLGVKASKSRFDGSWNWRLPPVPGEGGGGGRAT